jgi:hypothetical protein
MKRFRCVGAIRPLGNGMVEVMNATRRFVLLHFSKDSGLEI